MSEQFINLSILFDKGPKENRKHRREVMDEKEKNKCDNNEKKCDNDK